MIRIAYILLLLVHAFDGAAQIPEFRFHHITEKDGLSDNFVNAFLRDRRGGIWISTHNGLNYYDGAHFAVFRNTRDTNSLINNVVNGLCQDREGNIWGATENGVFCYQISKNHFRQYRLPTPDFVKALLNTWCDANGHIWAIGLYSLFMYDNATGGFREVTSLSPSPDSVQLYSARRNSFLADPAGKGFWIGTRSGMLYYDIAGNRFYSHRNRSDNPLFIRHSASALAVSPKGHYWYFDNAVKEAVAFDPVRQQILHRVSVKHELPITAAVTLFESTDGKLWLSTYDNRIIVVDTRENNKTYNLEARKDDGFAIAGNIISAAMEDEDGNVWLGTTGGISKFNPAKSLFRIHSLSGLTPALSGKLHINIILEHPDDHSWWMATSGEELVRYDPVTGETRSFAMSQAVPNKRGELPGPISSMKIVDGRIWVCTHGGTGIWEMNEAAGRLFPISPLPPPFENFIPLDAESSGQREFFFTDGRQLIHWDKRTGKVERIMEVVIPMHGGRPPDFTLLKKKRDQPLWVSASYGWLARYQDGKSEMVRMIGDIEKESTGWFNSLDLDKEGNVWLISTGVGLYHYNINTKKVKLWTEAEGLIDNYISSVTADAYGNIWCSGRHKFSVFTPANGYFYNFRVPLYQQNATWDSRSILLANNHVIVASFNDVLEFFPDRLMLKPAEQAPIISGVSISGKAPMLKADSALNLQPSDNSISIKFGILTDKELFPYTFRYKLAGFKRDWQQAGDRQEATYDRLPPGRYRFIVQAMAKNNAWFSPEASLEIHIAKPFYQTVLFRVMALLMVGGMLYAFYRYRLQQQRQILTLETRAESLEKEKAMIQYESLKQHLNPHFLFNSLTSLRSLIKSDSKTAAWFLDGLSRVYRYVLKSADQELVLLQDEAAFVQTFTELQKVRFGDGLQVHIRIDEASGRRYIAPVVLQNLVENCIKHNTTSADSPLVIDIYTQDDYLVVRNNLQRYRVVETSNKQGLVSLQKLYSFYTEKPVAIEENDAFFQVNIPLL